MQMGRRGLGNRRACHSTIRHVALEKQRVGRHGQERGSGPDWPALETQIPHANLGIWGEFLILSELYPPSVRSERQCLLLKCIVRMRGEHGTVRTHSKGSVQ